MTTEAEATKGVPVHVDNSTYTPRADHNALAYWVRDKVGEKAASFAALPITENFTGRLVTTEDNGSIYRYYDGGWNHIHSEWDEYVPTTTNISGGSISAAWARTGDIVHVRISHVLTGANFSGQPSYSLPVEHLYSDIEWLDGMVMLRDSSPATEILGVVRKGDVNAVAPYVITASLSFANFGNISATNPFTWASGDSLVMNFSYRAA